ncbi:MAG: hypothetical protein GY841_01830 [FCB group bacterium]|nr:hypothetical protein [FCB group bacterium]
MDQELDLKKLERRAYLTYHNDGLWDISLGLALLIVGLMVIFELAHLVAIFPAVLLPSVVSIKKSVTQRRLGYVKFSPEREAQDKKNKFKLTILLTMTMLAGMGAFYAFTGNAAWQVWIQDLRLIPFGFVLSLIIGVLGFLYGIYRFVLYGVIILAVFIGGHYAHSDPGVYFLLPGIMFTLVGTTKLIIFLRRYPKVAQETIDGSPR